MTEPTPARTPEASRLHPADLRGLGRLAVDGVLGVTDLVEHLHSAIAQPGRSTQRTRGVTGLVYRSVRGITRGVGGGIDLALAPFSRLRGDAQPLPGIAARSALNGIVGDHLHTSGNPLALPMTLHAGGRAISMDGSAVPVEQARSHIVLFLHGLCLHPGCWTPDSGGVNLPRRIATLPGRTVLHLHYNTGRSIADNGAELATRLDDLHQRWPVEIERLSLVGHSMGGLLARSTAHYGVEADMPWADTLQDVITLGSPHHGSPLERAGHWVERALGRTPYTRPFDRLGRMRSAGIRDLRHGRIAELGDALRLPEGTRLHLLAASRSPGSHRRPAGDGLVPVNSALARQLPLDPARTHRRLVHDCGHMTLVHHPATAEHVVDALSD